jgi:hypothetical protein
VRALSPLQLSHLPYVIAYAFFVAFLVLFVFKWEGYCSKYFQMPFRNVVCFSIPLYGILSRDLFIKSGWQDEATSSSQILRTKPSSKSCRFRSPHISTLELSFELPKPRRSGHTSGMFPPIRPAYSFLPTSPRSRALSVYWIGQVVAALAVYCATLNADELGAVYQLYYLLPGLTLAWLTRVFNVRLRLRWMVQHRSIRV